MASKTLTGSRKLFLFNRKEGSLPELFFNALDCNKSGLSTTLGTTGNSTKLSFPFWDSKSNCAEPKRGRRNNRNSNFLINTKISNFRPIPEFYQSTIHSLLNSIPSSLITICLSLYKVPIAFLKLFLLIPNWFLISSGLDLS